MEPTKKTYRGIFRFLLGAAIAVCMPPDTQGKSPSGGRERVSIEEIENQLAALRNRVDSLVAVRDKLRQDSAETMRDLAMGNEKRAETADALAEKQRLIEETKRRYEKARLDSAAITADYRKRVAGIRAEIARLDVAIDTRSNELAAITGRRGDERSSRDSADERAAAKLNRQLASGDSAIGLRQADVSNCTVRRDRLIRDSLQAETKLISERNRYSMQISRLDSMIAATDAAIDAAERKRADERSENERKAARLRNDIAQIRTQRGAIDGRITLLNAGVSSLQAERKRLDQSSGAARVRYEKLLAPYKISLADKENTLKRIGMEKPLLLAIRQKLRLDSAIAKAREALDEAVRMQAEKKRKAKKLVAQREAELDSLIARLDILFRATAGLREKADKVRGATLARKTALVDSALAGIDGRIASMTAAVNKARRELAGFEQKNPPPSDPAARRIAAIDSISGVRKKEIIQLTERNDSLGMLLRESQNAVAAFAARRPENAAAGPDVKVKRSERSSVSAKRSQLVQDSARADAANSAELRRVKSELASTAGRLAALRNEIALHTASREKTNGLLAAMQDVKRRKSDAQLTQKSKNDSLAATKQREITALTEKTEKQRRDSSNLSRQHDQRIYEMNPSPSALAIVLSRLTGEVTALRTHNDSLKKGSLLAQKRSGDETRKYASWIASSNRQIENTMKEISLLTSSKQDAYSRIKNDRVYYDSLIDAIERELAAIVARRDKARHDSAAAENSLRRSSRQAADEEKEHDAVEHSRKKELLDLQADCNRARDDSIRTAARIPNAMQQYQQTARSIDALISIKEKEVADLRLKRDKNRQDSASEYKRQLQLLAAAHDEIVQRSIDLARKENELSLATTGTKNTGQDTVSLHRELHESIMAATLEIQRLTAMADKKHAALSRAKEELDAATGRIRSPSEESAVASGRNETSYGSPLSPALSTSEPALSPSVGATPKRSTTAIEIAQKRSEEIYSLLGENRIAEGTKLFKQLQPFLKMNLDPEAFQTLKNTIDQMGGG